MFFGSFARGLGLCQLGVRLLLLESVLLAILQGRAHQAEHLVAPRLLLSCLPALLRRLRLLRPLIGLAQF